MPAVIPIFAAIGGAVGVTGAGAVAAGVAVTATTASAGLAAYGAIQQNKAARNAASVDQATADYNARADIAAANQLDLDTQENIRTQRDDNSIYLSRQAASYAAAGVLSNTGSALHAQITNAGRMEQQIQQAWVNSNQKQQQYAAAAKVGRLEGAARAEADRAQGTIALINGGAKIASSVFGASQSGIFS